MSEIKPESAEVNARILYWGIPGAGVSSNLRTIHAKLRPDRRGDLVMVATPIDPTAAYELLPIALGEINGLKTQIQIIGVPASPEQAPTRMQLLDRIDGLVIVVDSRQACVEQNIAHVEELRETLSAYGRTLDDVPVVIQYNKHDLADPYAIEEIHRRLQMPNVAVFEAVATDATGVLQTLTTISKRVVRNLRDSGPRPAAALPAADLPLTPEPVAEAADPIPAAPVLPEPEAVGEITLDPARGAEAPPASPLSATQLMESAILAEDDVEDASDAASDVILDAQSHLDRPWGELAKESDGARIGRDLQVLSVGTATRQGERGVRIPVVLGNDDGESVTISLTIQLDPLLDDDPL